ncbi:MAG TPA: alpha/beta hydrolase [Hyphomonadaceae bacterium]|nr:alpha/beta hydrolase [Hyphomonadaceae bacterium]
MEEKIDRDRRALLGAVAAGVAADLTIAGPASAQGKPATPPKVKHAHTTMGTLKQIDAGDLSIGYAEAGPESGRPVLLLHGWPYDVHTYVDVMPALAEAGYRVIVPYLRGYGSTRLRSSSAPRNGQQAALAVDAIALMDALQIDKALIGGCDWGARTANILAAAWPQRCKGLVSVSGYLIGSQAANRAPLPPASELAWWYQFYFATERGAAGYKANTRDFAKLIWTSASPKWRFDDATFARSAAALDNPDHVDIVIHNYRWRLGLAQGEAKHDARRSAWRRARRFLFPPSRWRATQTALLIRTPLRTRRNSPAPTCIAWRKAGLATIFPRRRRTSSQKPSSM